MDDEDYLHDFESVGLTSNESFRFGSYYIPLIYAAVFRTLD